MGTQNINNEKSACGGLVVGYFGALLLLFARTSMPCGACS
jgi:hypothetical protein